MNEPAVIEEMLRQSKTIAVVGMSWQGFAGQLSHWEVPGGKRVSRGAGESRALKSVLGMTCYPDLDAAAAAMRAEGGRDRPGGCVSARPKFVPPIIEDVDSAGHWRYLWLQDGVTAHEAVQKAKASGVKCVQNDCIYRRHAQMF